MREQHTTTILDDAGGEHIYSALPLPAKRGFRTMRRLMGLAGQVLSGAGETDMGLMASLLTSVAEGNDELAQDMLYGVRREDCKDASGKPVWQEVSKEVIFDDVYAANYGELFRALWWVLEVNYGPLFGASTNQFNTLLQKLAGLLERANSVTSSPGIAQK